MKGRTNNPNGRPKGRPNLLTRELRSELKTIVETELQRLPQYLDALPDDKRLDAVLRLLPYVLPKVEAVTATDGEPLTLDWAL